MPAVAAITVLGGVLRLVSLGAQGTNPFYDAAVRSMGMSWHNFFLAAFEPSAVVAIDKPPVDLWFQVVSVKLFGFGPEALILPQAIAGTLAVPLLYDVARRLFGRPAGVAAALALAVMPVSVMTARSDTMDSLMMALNVAAAWLVVRAAASGRRRFLFAAAAVVGLNFEVKLFEALVALPALVVLYLLAEQRPLRRSVAPLAAAAAVVVAAALAWPTAASLVSKSARPYPLGSTNGSVWNAIFVFNGTQRLNPPKYNNTPAASSTQTAPTARAPAAPRHATRHRASHPAGGTLSGSGEAPGALRLFELGGYHFGQDFGIELAGALGFGALALAGAARRRCWRDAGRLPRAGAIAAAVWIATGYLLFSRSHGVVYVRYLEAITPAVAIALGAGAIASAREATRSAGMLVALAAVTALVTAYAVKAAGSDHALAAVSVIAAVAALAAAVVGQRRRRPALAAACAAGLLASSLIPAFVTSRSLVAQHQSDSGGATGAETSPLVRAESAFLRSHQRGARYEAATYSFAPAAPLVVHDGRPVLVLTSYTSPVVSAQRLAREVRAGQVRYALVGGHCGTAPALAVGDCPDVIRWLRRHAIDITSRTGLPGTGLLFELHA